MFSRNEAPVARISRSAQLQLLKDSKPHADLEIRATLLHVPARPRQARCLSYFGWLLSATLAFLFLAGAAGRAVPPAQWLSRGAGGGGAFYAPSFSAHAPGTLFVGSDMSDLFRSDDTGASWTTLDAAQIQGGHASSVQFTSDPTVAYCLDYSTINLSDLIVPSRSTDGGKTWTRLATDPTGGNAYRLFADAGQTGRVIVSDYLHVYCSNDGGATFPKVYETADNSAGIRLAGVFFDGANVAMGTNQGLLVSSDGGATFQPSSAGGVPAGEFMVSFAGARTGAATRLFCVTSTMASADITGADNGGFRGIYTLDSGQANRVKQVNGIPAGVAPFFVAMAPGNTSIAYVAGGGGAPIVYKTTNGGGLWQSVLLTANNQNVRTGWSGSGGDRDWSYGEYALGLAVAPSDPARAAIGDLGFVHLTTDGGATWRQAYVAPADENPAAAATPRQKFYAGVGLEDTTAWWLAWSDRSNLYAGFTDIRGIRSSDGGAKWAFSAGANLQNTIYHVLAHSDNGMLYAAGSSVHDLYESTYLTDARIDAGAGRVLSSTDRGATWQILHEFNHPVVFLALDPNDPHRLLASVVHSTAGGVFVTDDLQNGAASAWTQLANPPRTEGHPYNIHMLQDGTLVATYSGRRNSVGAFTAGSGVFAMASGAAAWTDRSDAGMRYWTKDLVIDPSDATQSTWYVGVFSGWGGLPNGLGGLYKTTNRGQDWQRINALDRVESCSFNPGNSNEMYLTTETDGLWYSANARAAAPSFARVAAYPFRHPLRVFFNPFTPGEIWVTSFGNGLRVSANAEPAAIPAASSWEVR